MWTLVMILFVKGEIHTTKVNTYELCNQGVLQFDAALHRAYEARYVSMEGTAYCIENIKN